MSRPIEKPVSRKTKLLIVCISILIGLFFAEIALRVVGYYYPIFYTTDWDRGYALKPYQEGWYRKEGASYVRINSEGLRDREHNVEKPANTFRIAVIGDSYAEAFQVDMSKAFWVLMERDLKQCTAINGRQVEVINFGVSGYSTAQELLTLRQKVWAYKPDVVLLAFTTNNDVTDNSRALKKTDEIPYFVHRGGQLVLDNSFRDVNSFKWRNSKLNTLGRWLRDNLRILHLIHHAQVGIKTYLKSKEETEPAPQQPALQPPAPENKPAQTPSTVVSEIGIENQIYTEPKDTVWLEAWRVTESLLVEMNKEVKEGNAKFFVVTLSNGIQVVPNVEWRNNFMKKIGVTDLFYPDFRVKSLGEREGFPVYTLAPELKQYADKNQIFLHGFDGKGNGHWNADGHRIAGELITKRLCEVISR